MALPKWLADVQWSNVVTGLVLAVVPTLVTSYVGFNVLQANVGNIGSKLDAATVLIERVDDRSKERRLETLTQVYRELDTLRQDVREVRAVHCACEKGD